MIKRMRIAFVAITMGALLVLLAAIFIATNVFMENQSKNQIDEFLSDMAVTDGGPPMMPSQPASQLQNNQELIEGFSVKIDTDGNVIEILNARSKITQDEAEIYADQVIKKGEDSGKVDTYQFLVQDRNFGKIIVFANQGIQNALLNELKNLSFVIGGISVLFLFIVVTILSKLVTRPVERAFEKQKRFITDSSHELKTPLSIMSANADVLEMEMGENKWLSQIKEQTKRMSKLIHELLVLTKTEAVDTKLVFTEFDLSNAIRNAVLPFDVLAFEKKKQIACGIEENIMFRGDEKSIKNMMEALMDNAVKYSNENSTIVVKLFVKGTKRVIEIFNEGQGVSENQKDKLFEKFYRVDDSRARETGGYGIGLSIVKSIVDMHKGKIETESDPGKSIVFRIILPVRTGS